MCAPLFFVSCFFCCCLSRFTASSFCLLVCVCVCLPLKRYLLVRLLGQGSYGEVAEGLDLAVAGGRRVAVKRVANLFREAIEAKRVYREVEK